MWDTWNNMRYIGVHKFLDRFKPDIDWDKKAKNKAKEKGVTKEVIEEQWEKKRELGKVVHKKIQQEEAAKEGVKSWNIDFINKGGFYEALPEKDTQLENGIYLEKPIFSYKQGLIGFPDKIEVKNNEINIEDYKTFTKLYRTSPTLRVGGKVLKDSYSYPIPYLDACNYIDTCLQLSLYMYILWENNRHLKVGKLFLTHIVIDESGKIQSRNKEEIPYMREEVRKLLQYKRDNDDSKII